MKYLLTVVLVSLGVMLFYSSSPFFISYAQLQEIIKMEELKCHICGEITDFICEDCEEPVCEDCAVSYTPQNNCEGTHCEECYDSSQAQWAEEVQGKEEYERIEQEKRNKRNDAAWKRYHSLEQSEKRRLLKIELTKERRANDIKRMQEVGNILKGFRF